MATNKNIAPRFVRTLIAGAAALACFSASAATIVITSRDAPGVGFNDPTPVAPVGGNPGTTLGQQRYNVYRYVADIWEKNLDSNVTIKVSAGWEPLTCTAGSATLGSAGAYNFWHDFAGGKPGIWYPQALANKLAGVNLSEGTPDDGTGYADADIKTQFNINLGKPDCLAGSAFYLGLDGKAGADVNFVETLLHELGHGLGFSLGLTSTSSGKRVNADFTAYTEDGLPSPWEEFMYDNTSGKSWLKMTSAERKASAINPLKLAWTGPNAVAGASMLRHLPVLNQYSPAGTLPQIDFNTASFGAPLPSSGAWGSVAVVATQPGETGPGCDPFNAANATAVKGKVALISRGACAFVQKVKNAQNAGAIGAILYNNAAGAIAPGGTDASVTIAAAGITQADGQALVAAAAAAAKYGSRGAPGAVSIAFGVDAARIAGADKAGRPLLYSPATLAPGSSVSHWDVTATPNLLMEPNINPDLGTVLVSPKDLTLPLLKDIGW
ncbi:PA domain-containing protein [Pseudoduganella violaceinigra]|uniref:PA domain-containing protein n=1 Tax=Pseudoduganella violaceinigra TaxID=246602 RepID=UPI0003F4EE67|nr:PA domain-containing protein [Pseudoduganella violaceinigra]